MRKNEKQLMTLNEFDAFLKNGDRIEAIVVAFHDNRLNRLPDNYFKHWQKLKRVYSIMVEAPTTRIAKQKLRDTFNISYDQMTPLINEVQELFPRLEEANKEFDRLMEIDRLERLIYKIEYGVETTVKVTNEAGEDTGEEETILIGGDVHSKSLPALKKLLLELKGLLSNEPTGPPADFTLPIPQFSTDINDLPQMVGEEVEYEEITK